MHGEKKKGFQLKVSPCLFLENDEKGQQKYAYFVNGESLEIQFKQTGIEKRQRNNQILEQSLIIYVKKNLVVSMLLLSRSMKSTNGSLC